MRLFCDPKLNSEFLTHSLLEENKLCTKIKFSIENFFRACDEIFRNCEFGHIYLRNP